MKLLISVLDAAEAELAAAAGADVIDVKDPREGSLGAPSPATLRAIAAVVGDRPLSVALGDLPQLPNTAALAAAGAAACGAQTVKVGLRGARTVEDAVAMLVAVAEAVRPYGAVADAAGVPGAVAEAARPLGAAARRCGAVDVVAAAYVDGERLADPPLAPALVLEAVVRAGVAGCLLDTAVKDGRGLLDWCRLGELRALAASAHEHGISFGVAGQLTIAQIGALRDSTADLVGVRSAVCAGAERTAAISPALIREAIAAARMTTVA